MAKIIAFPLSLIFAFLSLLGVYLPKPEVTIDKESRNTNYPYVFVHGLMGRGEYDARYKLMPYRGMFGGELLKKIMESMFVSSANEMGSYTGVTEGGFVFGEEWLENDGLVNTISAMAPTSAPSQQYEEGNVIPGVWNVMPVYRGDHMSLQGGMMKTNVQVHELYLNHLDMINSF